MVPIDQTPGESLRICKIECFILIAGGVDGTSNRLEWYGLDMQVPSKGTRNGLRIVEVAASRAELIPHQRVR